MTPLTAAPAIATSTVAQAGSIRARSYGVLRVGLCEHTFVGACGSPYAAFRRAIEARNLTRALTEVRDLPQISLVDAATYATSLRCRRNSDRRTARHSRPHTNASGRPANHLPHTTHARCSTRRGEGHAEPAGSPSGPP
jgi:hypothetical protein